MSPNAAIDLSQFTLKIATPDHCNDICNLINQTYRGDIGWTRETDIIDGNRTNLDEIIFTMSRRDGQFFVNYCHQLLIACIYLAKEQNAKQRGHAYLGFFSVHPDFQGQGIGKNVLQQIEAIAKKQLLAKKILMFVVSQRSELIAFYERRGYIRTGRIEDYPVHLGIGIPRVEGLTIEYLEKKIY